MNWTAVASLLAALAAVAGVVFTGLSLQATRTQNAVNEQGQLTDRFTKAVDQLDRAGPEHLQARLGAVYALERLARDSARDHPTIIEVLSAFVRTTGGLPPSELVEDPHCPKQFAPDIQAAITVLGRRDTTRDQGSPVNLRHVCLLDADLDDANLAGADLDEAHLTQALLTGANLANTNLARADLARAHLDDADLTNADLTNARLGDADLANANLTGADLIRAHLDGADLTSADLTDANLTGANLVLTRLDRADLTRADLSGADLTFVYLLGANLSGADLSGTDLTGAVLIGADLTGARHDEGTVVKNAVVDGQTKGTWW